MEKNGAPVSPARNESSGNKAMKSTIVVLAVVTVVLAGVFAYVWFDRQSLIDDLTVEKEQLTQDLVSLQGEYSILSSDNDSLNVQLDREREKIDQLLERIKKTDAANRSKIRQYEKELGTLRSIMKHYIVQIDSLNTLNTELRRDAEIARRQAEESSQKYEELSKTTDEYAKLVEKGSAVKGRGVSVTAINSSNKDTERSSRARKLRTCLYLVENSIAQRGPMTVYIRVKGPDSILMTNDQNIFTVGEEQMLYTESREVDYQGEEVEVCIYFAPQQGFVKGVYTVEAYTAGGLVGTGEILLK